MPDSTESNLELLADDYTLFEICDTVDNVIQSLQVEIRRFHHYATKKLIDDTS